jgi:hypothetical protein
LISAENALPLAAASINVAVKSNVELENVNVLLLELRQINLAGTTAQQKRI